MIATLTAAREYCEARDVRKVAPVVLTAAHETARAATPRARWSLAVRTAVEFTEKATTTTELGL